MIWRDYLTADEGARLEAIPAERRALTREYKAIFERCRKRAERAGTKTDSSNRVPTAPTDPQES